MAALLARIREFIPTLEGIWSLAVLRHCTDTHGVMCWGCGRRAHRIGTEPTAWLERLCIAPGCEANAIAGVKR